jgi:predicted amidohydrolase
MSLLIALQMVSGCRWQDNILAVERLLVQLPMAEQRLVVLPENFALFAADPAAYGEFARHDVEYVRERLGRFAREHGCWLVAGSLPLLQPGAVKPVATALVFNHFGQEVGRYHKLHLFDVEVADSQRQYCESNHFLPGKHLTMVDSPFGRIGVGICYDLRFPLMFDKLRELGAELLVLPAAFTRHTGLAHWEILVRARAIETQCYLLAADQGGLHENGRETFGHTMIVSPWGERLDCHERGEGWACATLDRNLIKAVRSKMPIAAHSRFEANWRKHNRSGT